MVNIVEQAKNSAGQLQKNLLGEPYSYADQIKTTKELGMSDRGDLATLERDVKGVIAYVKVLIEGGGAASKVKGPLGNKFFMKTAMLCKNNGKDVPRSIYINNVPGGALPGLIKGMTTGLNAVNPFRLMGAFADATTPECQQVTLEVIDSNNRKTRETHYMTVNDLDYINNDLLGFKNMDNQKEIIEDSYLVDLPEDFVIQAYYICLAVLATYIVYRLMIKSKK